MSSEEIEKNRNLIADHMQDILTLLGEDTGREGLIKTPQRVAKAMQYLTRGYWQDPEEILRSALFKENYRQMVIVKDIDLFSMCEHHMLPFYGKAHGLHSQRLHYRVEQDCPVVDILPVAYRCRNGLPHK